MKKLTRKSLNELAKTMPVIEVLANELRWGRKWNIS